MKSIHNHAIILGVKTIIAVDIGGTQIRVAVYPQDGTTPILQKRIPTRGSESAVERILGLIAELWPAGCEVQAISAGAPGQIDPLAGVVIGAPNIAGWENLPLRAQIEERFHTQAFVNNDANLAALGEWRFGAARGHHNVLYMTISTGIGGGVIMNDQLLLGQHGLATELGHVVILPDGPMCGCGFRGHLEALSSGTGIARYVNEELARGAASSLPSSPPPTAREIAHAAAAGDALARAAFDRAAYYLGIGLANYLHLFNPSIVVLGGGVSRSGDFFWQAFRRSLEAHVLLPEYSRDLIIAPAALLDDCGLLGALALAQGCLA
jgi:glucokinase